jgi:hypothetical protein
MAEGRDIRALTRAIDNLARVTEALNSTLVEIEKRRRADQNRTEHHASSGNGKSAVDR